VNKIRLVLALFLIVSFSGNLLVPFNEVMYTEPIIFEDAGKLIELLENIAERATLTSHSQIIIDSNADFITQGWSGNGTVENPYLIENLEIAHDSYSVLIVDTDVFFTIRNCNLTTSSSTESCVKFSNINNGILENCTITSSCFGIEVNSSDSCVIRDNVIGPVVTFGIYLHESQNINASRNAISNVANSDLDLYDSCLYLDGSDYCMISENVMSNAPHITYMRAGSYCNFQSNILTNAITYDSITTVSMEELTIFNNTISDTRGGINSNYDYYCTFDSNHITADDSRGIIIRYGNGMKVTKNNVSCDLFGYDFQGMTDYIVTDNIAHDCKFGLAVSETISDTLLFNNSAYDCEFGFFAQSTIGGSFERCTAYNNDVGFAIQSSTEFIFEGNAAYENDIGFSIRHDDFHVLSGNLVYNNLLGIEVWNSCWNSSLFENYIIANSVSDDGAGNIWDNDVDTGNYWGAYAGEDNITIPGTADSIDRYPNGYPLPDIEPSDDIEFEFGAVGLDVSWFINSIGYPSYYEIVRNSQTILHSAWDGSEISFCLDELEVDNYEIQLFIFDWFGNSANSSILVNVSDRTSPFVSSPLDIEFEEGTTGNHIVWILFDYDPYYYDIYLNQTLLVHVPWVEQSETVDLLLDDFNEGTYNVTLRSFDSSNNTEVDTVWVTVLEQVIITTPTTPTNSTTVSNTLTTNNDTSSTTLPGDFLGILSLTVTIGSLGVIIVVCILIARSKNTT
jgi:parallel beta-helix repeat protein